MSATEPKPTIKTPAAIVGQLRCWAADLRRDLVMRDVLSVHLSAMDDAAEVIESLQQQLAERDAQREVDCSLASVANEAVTLREEHARRKIAWTYEDWLALEVVQLRRKLKAATQGGATT